MTNLSLIKRLSLTVSLCLVQVLLFAQSADSTGVSTFDDTMRSHDKIYVVMAVCLVILIAMILYLVRIDSKISKKEK